MKPLRIVVVLYLVDKEFSRKSVAFEALSNPTDFSQMKSANMYQYPTNSATLVANMHFLPRLVSLSSKVWHSKLLNTDRPNPRTYLRQ